MRWELIYVSNPNPKFCMYKNRFALPRTYLVGSYITPWNERGTLQATKDNIRISHFSSYSKNHRHMSFFGSRWFS